MLSFTNKHSLNLAEVGRHQGSKRPRAHFVKAGRKNHVRGFYRPTTNIPEFVLNEFQLSLSCPEKEASILRSRAIQGGSRPLPTAPLWQHSGKLGQVGGRAASKAGCTRENTDVRGGYAQPSGRAGNRTRADPLPPLSSSCLPPRPHFACPQPWCGSTPGAAAAGSLQAECGCPGLAFPWGRLLPPPGSARRLHPSAAEGQATRRGAAVWSLVASLNL